MRVWLRDKMSPRGWQFRDKEDAAADFDVRDAIEVDEDDEPLVLDEAGFKEMVEGEEGDGDIPEKLEIADEDGESKDSDEKGAPAKAAKPVAKNADRPPTYGERAADTTDIRILRELAEASEELQEKYAPLEPHYERIQRVQPALPKALDLIDVMLPAPDPETGELAPVSPEAFEKAAVRVNRGLLEGYRDMLMEDFAEEYAVAQFAERLGIEPEQVMERLKGGATTSTGTPVPAKLSAKVQAYLADAEPDVADEIESAYAELARLKEFEDKTVKGQKAAEAKAQERTEIEVRQDFEKNVVEGKLLAGVLRKLKVQPAREGGKPDGKILPDAPETKLYRKLVRNTKAAFNDDAKAVRAALAAYELHKQSKKSGGEALSDLQLAAVEAFLGKHASAELAELRPAEPEKGTTTPKAGAVRHQGP
jgi:hypothetical protein